MSQENVELIRRAIEAWNGLMSTGWLDQLPPISFGFRPRSAALERSVYRGGTGTRSDGGQLGDLAVASKAELLAISGVRVQAPRRVRDGQGQRG